MNYKPDVNIEDDKKKTALIYLLENKAGMSVIQKCIDAGADVNTQVGGNTPLMCAVESCGIDVIASLLMNKKIKVDIKNAEGLTACDLAIKKYGKKHPISRLLRSYNKK
jgi:ankyrin repeat protein